MRYTSQVMTLPSAAERRITLRMLSYWERLRAGRPMPTEEDIDPDDLQDLWQSCFLVHVKDLAQPDYNYTYLGEEIAQMLATIGEGELRSAQIKVLSKSFSQLVASQKPLLEEGEFQNMSGETVKFRQCLLPLGSNGQVHAILGGIRFKVFS